jgi:hypothetical protein
MPTPEGAHQSHSKSESNKESEDIPYFEASHFPNEQSSEEAYFTLQSALEQIPAELSSFRINVQKNWYIAVVGKVPPDELTKRVEDSLSQGERVQLADSIVQMLKERHRQAIKIGPWVEGHYRRRRIK